MANSMFSKRHYEAIAEVFRDHPIVTPEIRDDLRDALADLFEADNPIDGKGRGFKREKFEEACER